VGICRSTLLCRCTGSRRSAALGHRSQSSSALHHRRGVSPSSDASQPPSAGRTDACAGPRPPHQQRPDDPALAARRRPVPRRRAHAPARRARRHAAAAVPGARVPAEEQHRRRGAGLRVPCLCEARGAGNLWARRTASASWCPTGVWTAWRACTLRTRRSRSPSSEHHQRPVQSYCTLVLWGCVPARYRKAAFLSVLCASLLGSPTLSPCPALLTLKQHITSQHIHSSPKTGASPVHGGGRHC